MLSPNLIPLIDVTFSTPTNHYTHLALRGALERYRLVKPTIPIQLVTGTDSNRRAIWNRLIDTWFAFL
jgi:hypothetical protein